MVEDFDSTAMVYRFITPNRSLCEIVSALKALISLILAGSRIGFGDNVFTMEELTRQIEEQN